MIMKYDGYFMLITRVQWFIIEIMISWAPLTHRTAVFRFALDGGFRMRRQWAGVLMQCLRISSATRLEDLGVSIVMGVAPSEPWMVFDFGRIPMIGSPISGTSIWDMFDFFFCQIM